MKNPFAKFFAKYKKPEIPKPLFKCNDDVLPPGVEYAEEDCEGCDCGGECDCDGGSDCGGGDGGD